MPPTSGAGWAAERPLPALPALAAGRKGRRGPTAGGCSSLSIRNGGKKKRNPTQTPQEESRETAAAAAPRPRRGGRPHTALPRAPPPATAAARGPAPRAPLARPRPARACRDRRSPAPRPAATPAHGQRRTPRAAPPRERGPYLGEAVLAVGFRLYLHLHHHRVRPGHIAQHGWGQPAPPPSRTPGAAAAAGGESQLMLQAEAGRRTPATAYTASQPAHARTHSSSSRRLARCPYCLLCAGSAPSTYTLRLPLPTPSRTCGPMERRRSSLRSAAATNQSRRHPRQTAADGRVFVVVSLWRPLPGLRVAGRRRHYTSALRPAGRRAVALRALPPQITLISCHFQHLKNRIVES